MTDRTTLVPLWMARWPSASAEVNPHEFQEGESRISGKAPFEEECERKFSVDEAKLPTLNKPWLLVQGYTIDPDNPALEISLRLICSRGRAYLRKKTRSLNGCRMKSSQQVDCKLGIAKIHNFPLIVYKERYLFRDQLGRAWLIDHFIEQNHWQCETEFPDRDFDSCSMTPIWVTDELTTSKKGYAASYATQRTPAELSKLIVVSTRDGSKAPYGPAEADEQDATFPWTT